MKGRAIYEFGAFIKEMRSYLVFDEKSRDDEYRKFQETIDRSEWDSKQVLTYFILYQKFTEWWKDQNSTTLYLD